MTDLSSPKNDATPARRKLSYKWIAFTLTITVFAVFLYSFNAAPPPPDYWKATLGPSIKINLDQTTLRLFNRVQTIESNEQPTPSDERHILTADEMNWVLSQKDLWSWTTQQADFLQVNFQGLNQLKRFSILKFTDVILNETQFKQITTARNLQILTLNNIQFLNPQTQQLTSTLPPNTFKQLATPRLLTDLTLRNITINEDEFKHINQLNKLNRLTLVNNNITGAALQHIAALKKLYSLDLSNNPIQSGEFNHLGALTTLAHLNLANTAITDQGLKHLIPLTKLRRLNLTHTAITPLCFSILAQLQNLNTIILDNNFKLKHAEAITQFQETYNIKIR